jgi:hypothetical protein
MMLVKVLGCIDPFATNCEAADDNNCDCVHDIYNDIYGCATYQDDTCTYPDITLDNFYLFESSISMGTVCSCNHYDMSACNVCLADGSYPDINPLVEWTSGLHDIRHWEVEYSYDFSGLERDSLFHDYSITNGAASPINNRIQDGVP